MTVKYTAHLITAGIILERIYEGAGPDEVGTLQFWDEAIKQLVAKYGSAQYWKGLRIKIIDCNSPYNDLRRAQKIASLEDYNTDTPECEVGAGLFFDKTNEGVHIMVFRRDWHPDKNSPHAITWGDLTAARRTLAHELGHYAAWVMKYGSSTHYVPKQITKNIDALLPAWLAPTSKGEALAETYRAFFGQDEVWGKTSDNLSLIPANNAQLFTLLKTGPWLVENLMGSKIIDNFSVSWDRVFWQEFEIVYFPTFGVNSTGWFSVDGNLVKYKWAKVNGVDCWQKI